MIDDDLALKEPLDLPEDTTQQHAPAPKPPRKSPNYKVIVLILFVVAVLAVGGYFGYSATQKKPTETETPNTTKQTTKTIKTELPAATGTKSYTNDRMRLTLEYPNNWVVTEGTDGSFRVESPDFTYTALDKGELTGNFKIYARQGAQTADSKYIGKGVAVLPSEKLVYTKPAASQRKETNISFFGLDTPDNFAYLLIAGNFSLKKGDSLGPNYGKEVDTFIIGGGYASKDMKDGLETNKVAPDAFQQTTAYKQAVDILKSIQIN